MECSICNTSMENGGVATQVFRRNGVVVTVTGIPAVALCPSCNNAVLDWGIAEQVEELVEPIFSWADTHDLPRPIISITFPEMAMA